MRTTVVTVCRYERPSARIRITGALAEWKTPNKEDLRGEKEVVRLEERKTRVGGAQTGIEDEGGFHFVTRRGEHVTCTSVRERIVEPDS